MSVVLVEREAPIAVVLLNRPEALNALNDELMGELVDALTALDDDDEVRCVVLGGSERAFAAGADIGQMAEASAMEMYEARRIDRWDAIRRVRTPLVAAVSGFCLGGGNELAMACDLIVASETAQFGQPETGLGIIPGAGGTQRLTRAVGKAKAMDVILSGRFLTAEEAERAGLVARVVAKEAWLDEAKVVARSIAEKGPIAQRLAKESVNRAFESALGHRPRLRAQGALSRIRIRGRPRGADGLRREAQAGIPRALAAFAAHMATASRWHDPPRMRTVEDDDGDERHATWLELFFDLVFVVAVAQLADGLAGDPSLHGFLIFAGLFVAVWWAWVGYTFYADRFDTDDPPHRVLMLVGMFLVAVLASVIPEAFHGETAAFALAYAAVRASRRPPERARLVAPAGSAAAPERLHPSLHREHRPLRRLRRGPSAVPLLALGGGARDRPGDAARQRHAHPGRADPRVPHPGAGRPLHDHRLRREHPGRRHRDHDRELGSRSRPRSRRSASPSRERSGGSTSTTSTRR